MWLLSEKLHGCFSTLVLLFTRVQNEGLPAFAKANPILSRVVGLKLNAVFQKALSELHYGKPLGKEAFDCG